VVCITVFRNPASISNFCLQGTAIRISDTPEIQPFPGGTVNIKMDSTPWNSKIRGVTAPLQGSSVI